MQNIVLRSASGDASKVTLAGKGWERGDEHDDILRISRCEGVTIADLSFADCRSYGIKVEAEHTPRDVKILNCRFRDIGVRAIKGSAAQDPNLRAVKGLVCGCYFENTKIPPAEWLFGGDYIAAIDMMALEDWTFSDNVFRNIKGRNGGGRAAIFVWVRSRKVVVERNLIVNCDRGVAFGNPGKSTANLEGERLVYVSDGIIRNNFIAGGPDCGIELWYVDQIKVLNNSIWRPDQNWNRGIRIGTGTANTEIANNLVHGGIQSEGGQAQVHHNLSGRLDGYFEEPTSGNLALTSVATDALGRGVPLAEVTEDIRRRPRKGNPDLGAWELENKPSGKTRSGTQMPFAIPTFHCLGLYWSPPGGAAGKEVFVRYRRQGTTDWKEALPMRYNPIPKTDEDLADYRGSIVHLTPGTVYKVQLTLQDSTTSTNFIATTWSEAFPVGETIPVGSRDAPLMIKESGTPKRWRIYDGRGATIDVRHQQDACVMINASNVVLRGFNLRGAGTTNLDSKRIIGAIRIEGGQDIIIEDCDISDWGRLNPATGLGFDYDAAIFSRSPGLKRLIVQRCKLHHPTYDGSTWYEPKYPTHTQGPQCITLFNTGGNHVIRYNECFSDLEHMYNDGIGGGSNGSFQGSPGPDSDIYGNVISHCWDDGLEVEGGSRNVRIWDNYITQCMMMIGNAPCSIGPLYIWRNVVTRSQSQPGAGGGNFLKMGFANSEDWMTGQQYIFHNTIFGSADWLPTGGLGGDRIVKHTISRNNILHVRAPRNWSTSNNQRNADNDFDYDLFNGRVPSSQEPHGVRGEPVYAQGSGYDPETKIGRFQLAADSPGAGASQAIPNFSDGYTGKAPDVGAHQRGAPPVRYGVRATQP
ncbi:MAG TPA: right-handed parallel beta-helix repeat-containing protein [Verrucomicrobiae bacterium]